MNAKAIKEVLKWRKCSDYCRENWDPLRLKKKKKIDPSKLRTTLALIICF